MLSGPTVLMERLQAHASARGGELAFAFLSLSGERVELTWAQVHEAALRIAGYLRAAGCAADDAVLILTASPREQILAFLGAQACSAIPAILSYPSTKQSTERFWRMLRPVLQQSDARFLLHSQQFGSLVTSEPGPTRRLEIPAWQELPAVAPAPAGARGEVLFRQFSSGTTGARKSVLVTDAMFASHAASYGEVMGFRGDDRVVSWLPLYHDLGLVGSFLVPFWHGVFSAHLSPFEWLQRPSLMFRAIADWRGTLVWMPNFAFSYCAQRVSDADLDPKLELRRMRAFISAGEPVTARAQDEFIERFRKHGIERSHVQNLYGMAENTLTITHTTLGQPTRRDRVERDAFRNDHRCVPAAEGAPAERVLTFVSCGRPIRDTEVRIAGGIQERQVGEVELRGGSLFHGYSIAEGGESGTRGELTEDGWFRTGDLGYMVDGEVFVAGRQKDLIIHRGSNIYPTEVEEVVNRVEGCKAGRVAVFGVYDEAAGTEEVVAMLEPDSEAALPESDAAALAARVRAEVLTRFNVALSDVVVAAPQTLRKSTSGKVSRSANRAQYVEERPARRDAQKPASRSGVAARDVEERQIADIWRAVLGITPGEVRADFFTDLGGDSMGAVRVVEMMNAAFETSFGPELLLEARTIEQQAAQIRDRKGTHRVLVKFHTGGTKCPLFLAHPAGGSVFGYDSIARALPDRPVYGLQDPHIFDTRGVFESIEEMAEAYVPHIRRAHPEGPYMIGGWSLGGVLAFEIANRLAAEGAQVANLIVFDAASPPGVSERLRLWSRFAPPHALLAAAARSAALRACLRPLLRYRAARLGNDPIACAREMARFDIDESPGALEVFFPWLPRAELAQGLDHVLREAVHRAEAKDNIVPGVSPRNHVHRRRIHQRNLHTLFRRYRPTWRYEGLTTLFRQPEEHVIPWRQRGWTGRYDWARYCIGRLDTHLVELLATPAQPNPHDNTLLPLNTERYMPLVREAIDRSEPN